MRPASGRGRLIFALDATASRDPTWDRACQLQGEMFEATASLGGLDIQLGGRKNVTRDDVVERLRPLLDLPVELVLPAHGEPTDRAALERVLS